MPEDLLLAAPEARLERSARPVYAFMIAGAKVRAPAAAMALLKRLEKN